MSASAPMSHLQSQKRSLSEKKAKGERSTSGSSAFSQGLFLAYLVVYAFRWGTAHRWSGAWLAWEVPSSPLYVWPEQPELLLCEYL